MKRMAMLILALMLTVLPVAALGEGESTVTVYGYGKTYVTLDTAVITFEISASAKTVQEARKQHDWNRWGSARINCKCPIPF